MTLTLQGKARDGSGAARALRELVVPPARPSLRMGPAVAVINPADADPRAGRRATKNGERFEGEREQLATTCTEQVTPGVTESTCPVISGLLFFFNF